MFLLLLLSTRGIFFLSLKMLDGACLAAATYLALLQKGFPLHLRGQQALQNKWNVRLLDVTCRSHCTSAVTVVWLACVVPQGFEGTARDYWHYNFFSLKNPTDSSICLQRKCRCQMLVVAVGQRRGQPPEAVQGRSVSCIYIYIYIYLYIYLYAFPFPVSHQ